MTFSLAYSCIFFVKFKMCVIKVVPSNCYSFGANHDATNEKGVSPYDIAVKSDYNSIIALFNEPKDKKTKKKKTVKRTDSSDSENDSDLF